MELVVTSYKCSCPAYELTVTYYVPRPFSKHRIGRKHLNPRIRALGRGGAPATAGNVGQLAEQSAKGFGLRGFGLHNCQYYSLEFHFRSL